MRCFQWIKDTNLKANHNPAQGGQHRHAEFPAVYQGSGRGAGRQEELQPERDLAVLEHGGQEGAEGPV